MTSVKEQQLSKVTDHPVNTYIGTLANGLTVYMSVNQEEPRIQTQVAVKAGFQDDPDDATGLAHYLEHMMFKGSDRIGTQNWEAESRLLEQIEALYEEHRHTSDKAEKQRLYTRIDELSTQAAQYAVPNEYDKLLSAIGAKGTNAYTSFDQTVFLNDIPANELEKWLKIESERFRKLVLRLFHTELETVYEEFNMRNQDTDQVKIFDALFQSLFKEHYYGRQPAIGKPEHLKNPSMREVYKFFNTYYAPNNMAICLSGDLEPEQTFDLVARYFGDYEPVELPEQNVAEEAPFNQPVESEVWGNEAENVTLAFRLGGAKSRDAKIMKVLEGVLFNQKAGLVDLDLNQQQEVMQALVGFIPLRDYSLLIMNALPKEGQTLAEAQSLLLEEVEKVKKGQFEDWLVEAVINDLRLDQKYQLETNKGRSEAFVDAFTNDIPWESYINQLEELKQITKDDIVNFARENLDQNYAVIYKQQGQDPNVVRLEKPPITPVELNREVRSDFFREVEAIPSGTLTPRFLDFDEDMHASHLRDQIPFYHIKNPINDTFKLYYIFDMGSDHDLEMALALQYLPYLGTDRYSPQGIRQAFYHLGLTYQTDVKKDQAYIYLEGLEESLQAGVELFEHLLRHVQADADALSDLVANIIKEREDEKADKKVILREGMVNYGKYGPYNPFTNRFSREALMEQDAEQLVKRIQGLTGFQHRIFYYGQKNPEYVKPILADHHPAYDSLKPVPDSSPYQEQSTAENRVYFVDYDMVQSEMVLLSRDETYRKELTPYISLFNEYFGGGLSSIVYQEIRESKALAYTAFSYLTQPRTYRDSHYLLAYIGTQADKLKEALDALKHLMNAMPESSQQFESARHSVMKRIASERITRTKVFWAFEENRRRGVDYDLRKDVYETMQAITFEDLKQFYQQHVKGKTFHYLVLGSKENLDFDLLRSIGPIEELSLDQLFNDEGPKEEAR